MKRPKELETAISRAKRVQDLRTQIRTALQKAEADESTTAAAVQAALNRLGTAEADLALNGPSSLKGSEDAHKALRGAREGLDTVQARIEGLRRALSASEPELIAAAADLATQRGAFIEASTDACREELRSAAEVYAVAVRKAIILGRGLGVPFSALENFDLVGLRIGEPALVEMFPKTFDRMTTSWRHELPPTDLAVSEVTALSKSVGQEADAVRKRQEAETRAAAEAELRARPNVSPVMSVDYTRRVPDYASGTLMPGL